MNNIDIKEFRARHKLTQTEVSKIVGVGVGAVKSWEQGVRNISKSAILVLKKYDEENKESTIVSEPRENYGPDYKEMYFDAKYTIEVQKKYIESLELQLNSKRKAG